MSFPEKTQRKSRILPGFMIAGGVALACIPALLHLILGEDSWFYLQDQMDGELLGYIYRAKYLFRGDTIPEFMNGMGKASMMLPAPLAVLLFRFMSPFAAMVALTFAVQVTTFLGMYALGREIGWSPVISAATGLVFCYMPFYPVYGLCQTGIPLLLVCVNRWMQRKNSVFAMLGILFYGAMSSPALVGYLWIAFGLILSGICAAQGKRRPYAGRMLFVTGILLAEYLLLNSELIGSVTGKGFVSHRTEMEPVKREFLSAFRDLILIGGSYSYVYAIAILLLMGVVLIAALSMRNESGKVVPETARLLRISWGVFGYIVFFALLAAFWECSAGIALRKALGGPFRYFQADRVFWTFPCAWMVILGCGLEWVKAFWGSGKNLLLRILLAVIAFGAFALEGVMVFRETSANRNLHLLLVDGYRKITWESFYMEDVFDEIDAAIGRPKESYRVASLGLYPAIPLYNGFYCADGYSNNYDVEYKHRFAEIQSEELRKNDGVADMIYRWGNRLYLLAAPYGFAEEGGKGDGYTYSDLGYDMDRMKELGIAYLFANGPIVDGDFMGLTMLEGSPFTSDRAHYAVYVYELN